MTASAELRRTYTQRAAIAIGLSLVIVIVLGVIGARTLASSTIGSEAGDGDVVATVALPETTTAFIGVIDSEGTLQSAALMVVHPSGIGGVIVPIEAAADISAGRGESVVPLRDAFDAGDSSLFTLDAESITGLTFDFIEVVTPTELAAMLGVDGSVALDLPQSVVTSSGIGWLQGRSSVTAQEATELLAVGGRNPFEVGADLHSEVWRGLSALAAGADTSDGGFKVDLFVSIDDVVSALFSGSVETRTLNLYEVEGSGGALAYYDWAETLLVACHLAPSRVTAPYSSAVVRVLVPFSDDDLDDTGYGVSDVAVIAVRRLSEVGLNVVSVSTGPNADAEQAPEVTQVWTGDEGTVTDAADAFSELLGEVVAREGDYEVDGIDIVITLGTSFLADLDREIAGDLTAWTASAAGQ
ncbi:MAG: hypothetical protein O3A04_07760 [Actinomycetota bacterium]|nr:hypothetical protein [Actinomycetota bacterium]